MRIENKDKSTPLGKSVASANNIAADMQPRTTAESIFICFLIKQRQNNSASNCKQLSRLTTKKILKENPRAGHHL